MNKYTRQFKCGANFLGGYPKNSAPQENFLKTPAAAVYFIPVIGVKFVDRTSKIVPKPAANCQQKNEK